MAGEVEMTLQFPKTARDASVLLLGQILTAINLGHLVPAPDKVEALEKWKARAAVTLSDASVEHD